MKKLIILLLLVSTHAWGQSEKPNRTWEVEVDPIAFALKGYSGHLIYQPGRLRLDAGIFGIQQPESFHGNPGFTLMSRGFGLKASYLLQGTKGLFTGLGAGYVTNEATHTESGLSDTGRTIGIGAHLGYRFFLQKDAQGSPTGFFLAPWVSVDYNLHPNRISFENKSFKQSNWGYFPTIHVGYRF